MSLFWSLKNNPRFEKTLPLDPTLGQNSPVDKFKLHFVQVSFNIALAAVRCI